MSIDLVVAIGLTTAAQPIQDQGGHSSALSLATDKTYLASNPLVLGTDQLGWGEWIQQSFVSQTTPFGVSLYTNAAEQMRLTANTLTIGQSVTCDTTMNGGLTVSGAVAFPNLQSSSGADVVWNNGALGVQTSSARFKENIRELKEDFSRVLSLSPVSFTYKDSGDEAIGYTAEELHEKEMHHLVSYDEEGKPFSVNYKLLPIYLVEVVKKQQEMIARLEQGLARVLGGLTPPAEAAAG